MKKRIFWNSIVGALIGIIGYAGYTAGLGQPWEAMSVAFWWMYLIVSISVVFIIDFKTILNSLANSKIINSFGQRKREEEMLRVSKLYKEGILTKEECDSKISKLKQKSGY